MNRASYDVVLVSEDLCVIRDVGHTGCPSVTNDAERVVSWVYAQHCLKPWTRILYFDSDGRVDELLHKDGVFNGFSAFSIKGREEYVCLGQMTTGRE